MYIPSTALTADHTSPFMHQSHTTYASDQTTRQRQEIEEDLHNLSQVPLKQSVRYIPDESLIPPSNFSNIDSFLDEVMKTELDFVPRPTGQVLFPENSLIRKILSCIPILGVASAWYNEKSLMKKVPDAVSTFQIRELITIKNHYKIASIARQVLTVALVVAGIASGILIGNVATAALLTFGGLAGSRIAYYTLTTYKNWMLMQQLKTRPIQKSDRIH